ncbi:retrovirus-related pol polyprotein from transposon TNT 1-94 [Tanacetum coccineum]
MSNPNTNLQTQTSNALHNAIMEVGGKDRPPMLAPGNYVQWKSRIKRYIDTKPNNELIHYYLQNPPYKFKWTEKTILVAEGSSETTTEGYIENYKNVLQDIRDQLNAKAEAIQIILTGIDNDIYSTVDAYPNACEINRGKAIVNSSTPTYDQEPTMVADDDEMSKDKEIDKLMALISLSFKKIYKPTNNNLRTSSNSSRANQDNTPMINRGTRYDNQRVVNVVGARENVGTMVVQQSGIQCYNCKEYGHVARECQKPKWAKDAAYHKEKMLLCKQEEAGFQLNAEQADWRDDTDDESDDQELEAHYIEQDEHDDDDDLAKERDLVASLIEKLKCEIDESKNSNKFLETSNKALVDKLKDLKKFQTELDRYHDVNYASKVEIDYAEAKGDLISYKIESENFAKPEFLKKAQRANPRLYDIGCYNDNLALMLAPESDKTIRLAKESRSKLSDLIKPFDYYQLNNLYDLFVPQREKSPEQHYFSKESNMSHTSTKNEISKESFHKQTTVLEKRMDESIPWDQKCKSSKELF